MSKLGVMFRDEGDPIQFGQTFVGSEAFRALFKEGMSLVEETAAYLDGPGRDESRRLERPASLTYASESMRLTTRLMQIASWLLVQRAVAEGEITSGQAAREKTRVRLTVQEPGSSPLDFDALPERLRALIQRTSRMHARILHLDQFTSDQPPAAPHASPVALQQGLIRSAFLANR